MKAINVNEVPFNTNTQYAIEAIGFESVLDEGICEHSEYTYVGQIDDKFYFCWPPEFNPEGTSLNDWLNDLYTALTYGKNPWCDHVSVEDLRTMVKDVDIKDYWK